jgi:hypothetical protein
MRKNFRRLDILSSCDGRRDQFGEGPEIGIAGVLGAALNLGGDGNDVRNDVRI